MNPGRSYAAPAATTIASSVIVGYLILWLTSSSFWAVVLATALPFSYAASRRLGWAHPLAWFPAAFSTYFLIGSRNWIAISDSNVDFRSHVSDSALRLPALGCATFAIGVLLAEVLRRLDPPYLGASAPAVGNPAAAYRAGARVCFVIGTLSVATIIHRMGVPLLHPSVRSDVSGALRLGSSLLVPAGILAAERARGRERSFLVAISLVELVLLAYRTPVLLTVVTLGCLALLRKRLSGRAAIACVLVLVFGSTALYTFRLAHGNGTASGVTPTGALRYMPMLTPLYYSYAREGVAVWSRIAEAVPASTPYFGGRLQGAALVSLLPGHQESPRLVVSSLAYQSADPTTTLTPTIVGGPYLDFGGLGVALEMMILGLVLALMYQRASVAAADRTLTRDIGYAYAAALVLLSIHTGLLDGVLFAALPAATLAIVWFCALAVGGSEPDRSRLGHYSDSVVASRDL